jgi:predicted nuclease of restriction endonuclease-like (RecB) superfamily
MPDIVYLPPDYAAWLANLKTRIHAAQQRAALAVNRELVLLYWQLGQDILKRQTREGWGAKVIDRLAQDLRSAFPDMKPPVVRRQGGGAQLVAQCAGDAD